MMRLGGLLLMMLDMLPAPILMMVALLTQLLIQVLVHTARIGIAAIMVFLCGLLVILALPTTPIRLVVKTVFVMTLRTGTRLSIATYRRILPTFMMTVCMG